MPDKVEALLVHYDRELFDELQSALEGLSVKASRARTCGEAAMCLLGRAEPPPLVFTDVHLADGNWTSILRLAAGASKHVNVIVVAPHPDINLYFEALERGAFDFIAPPFAAAGLGYVVACSANDAQLRRKLKDSGAYGLNSHFGTA